jgi:adenylate cyclase
LRDDVPSLPQPAPEPIEGKPQSMEILFWDSIKDSTLVADYEAYPTQYPEGSFVALARTRLGEFAPGESAMPDPQDREVELSFWESVRESDNPATLQAYLEKYPHGEFKSLAEIRLREIDTPSASS